jgi:hypothetical protein
MNAAPRKFQNAEELSQVDLREDLNICFKHLPVGFTSYYLCGNQIVLEVLAGALGGTLGVHFGV